MVNSIRQNRMLVWVGSMLALASCVGNHRYDPLTERDLENWNVYRFEVAGVELEAPRLIRSREMEESLQAKTPLPDLYLTLDPILPPPGLLAEHYPRVQIMISRKNVSKLQDDEASYMRSGLYRRGTDAQREGWLWSFRIHTDLASQERGGYRYYRKDIVLNDEEILWINAELIIQAGRSPAEHRRDDEMIRRILNSVRPLPGADAEDTSSQP